MRARLAVLVAVLLAIGAGTVAAQRWQAGFTGSAAASASGGVVTLPAAGAAAVPVCPGPETLVVPAGGTSVPPPGPVVVGAVAARHPQSLLPAAAVPPAGQDGAAPVPAAPAPAVTPTGASPARLAGSPLAAVADGLGLLSLPRTVAGVVRLEAPRGASVPELSSVQLSLGRSGDLRGLAAMACPTASTQAWLVGGGTQVGRRGRLLIANPAATPAVVDVTVFGPKGPVAAPAGTGVVLSPGAQTALLVDALAPGLDAVAVHVQARSGRVVATLHDSYVRGLTPGGVDDVTPSAPAARRQYVPGVSVAPASGSSLPAGAADPGAVAVRVVNPGLAAVVVRVHLIGDGGELEITGGVVTVPAQSVADVPLVQVPPGTYTAVVDADTAVVAGAVVGRTVPGGQVAGTPAAVAVAVPPSELAWAASTEPLTGATVVALPTLTASTGSSGKAVPVGAVLSLAAPAAAAAVEVVEIGADGRSVAAHTVQVAAGGGAEQPLASTAVAVLVRPRPGAGPVVGALVLQVQDPAGPMVSVLAVRSGPTGVGARPTVIVDPRLGLRG